MIIFEDTRNQLGKHEELNKQLEELGVTVIRSKLYVGDYARMDNMKICVDTKKDYKEIANNICGSQHTRFRNDCIRAQQANIRLIILIEEAVPIEEWTSPKKRNGQPICQAKPQVLRKAMATMSEKYGVEFRHCKKSETAKTLIEISKEEGL